MKKIFIAALAALTAITGLHAQKADEVDVAKLTAKLAEAKAEQWWTRAHLNIGILLAQHGTPKTFDEFKEIVKTGADKITDYPSAKSKEDLIDAQIASKSRWWYKLAFIKEGYAYTKTHSKTNCMKSFILSYNPNLELSDSELYQETVNVCASGNLKAVEAMTGIRQILKLAPFMDEVTVKADLKKLNRLYSPLLIADKAAWEPVVAMIRTALETY